MNEHLKIKYKQVTINEDKIRKDVIVKHLASMGPSGIQGSRSDKTVIKVDAS